MFLPIHHSDLFSSTTPGSYIFNMSGCITAEELKFVLTHLPGKVSEAPSVLPNIVHGGGFRWPTRRSTRWSGRWTRTGTARSTTRSSGWWWAPRPSSSPPPPSPSSQGPPSLSLSLSSSSLSSGQPRPSHSWHPRVCSGTGATSQPRRNTRCIDIRQGRRCSCSLKENFYQEFNAQMSVNRHKIF